MTAAAAAAVAAVAALLALLAWQTASHSVLPPLR